jgi:hypothetical protein
LLWKMLSKIIVLLRVINKRMIHEDDVRGNQFSFILYITRSLENRPTGNFATEQTGLMFTIS